MHFFTFMEKALAEEAKLTECPSRCYTSSFVCSKFGHLFMQFDWLVFTCQGPTRVHLLKALIWYIASNGKHLCFELPMVPL